ncbi:MAG: hypothetical protein NTZ05_10060, partial [Chloroflexi bacterium]|nr:hypothetical protein [Chloroflexota bacterium]
MNFSSDQLLTLLLVNGYPILFGVVLAGAIGLPLPLSALLMAAGGLAAEGEFDLPWVVGIVLSAAVLGDCVSFGLARWAGEAIIHRHGKRVGLNAAKLTAARERTAGRTGLAIFLT